MDMDLAARGHNSFSLCRPYRALGQSASKPRAKALGYYLSPFQGSGGERRGWKVKGRPCQKRLWLSDRIRHLRCLSRSVSHDHAFKQKAELNIVLRSGDVVSPLQGSGGERWGLKVRGRPMSSDKFGGVVDGIE